MRVVGPLGLGLQWVRIWIHHADLRVVHPPVAVAIADDVGALELLLRRRTLGLGCTRGRCNTGFGGCDLFCRQFR